MIMDHKILVVDDEEDMLSMVERIVSSRRQYDVLKAGNGCSALDILDVHNADVVLADMSMSGMSGLELTEAIRKKWPEKTVVIMTAYGSIENAVDAMKAGAYDYLTKPFQSDDLILLLDRAMERSMLLDDRRYFRQELQRRHGFSELVGTSLPMAKIYQTVEDVAPTGAHILITGESGTGKELVARAIHYKSKRKEMRFAAVNCAALPEAVLESELFGHVKGAYTGAFKDNRGLIEEADGGTLFLDEVAEMSPYVQAKLLRVLQDGEFRSVGGARDKKADLRVISASNRNMVEEVLKGRFRQDLFYRLNIIGIEMPPLRDKKEDIPLLVFHFMEKYASKYEKEIKGIEPSAMMDLSNRPWKGNVRELENTIARAVAISKDCVLHGRDLSLNETGYNDLSFKAAKKKALTDFYVSYITSALVRNKGNISRTADECGMMRQSLQQVMKKYGISSEDCQ